MQKKILILILFGIPLFTNAQYGNKVQKKTDNGFVNKKNKPSRQIIVAFGASNFLGELGGANQIGTFFVKDLEFAATRPSAAIGYRYKFNRFLALKGGLHYLLLSGNDNLTQEPFRNNRNLSFRSHIFELSAQGEFFFTKESQGHLYRIKNAKGKKNYKIQGYVFAGVGVFYYNPQAKYHGKWVNLRPLSTEGEGLPGGPKKYSPVSVCIPYGIGLSEGIGKDWSIGIEVGIRKTFTDYIDDVSGNYYDNAVIRETKGQMAADLADPSIHRMPAEMGGDSNGGWQAAAGQQRGDPTHKDAYLFTNITVTYKLKTRRRIKSKF